jgi:hypothetical protein
MSERVLQIEEDRKRGSLDVPPELYSEVDYYSQGAKDWLLITGG